MKRAFSILLLTFLLLSGSRVAVNLHFCGGELASVEFFPKQKEACGKCGMKKTKTCCQDVSKVFSSEEHSFASFSFDFTQTIVALPANVFSLQREAPFAVASIQNNTWAHAPPSLPKAPKYILFRSLIV